MGKSLAEPQDMNEYLIRVVKEKRPSTVGELVRIVRQRYSLPERKVMEEILKLQNQGKLTFREPPTSNPSKLEEYITSRKAIWFWVILAVALATAATVFAVPEEAFPLVYARYILGPLFVLWLPGYSFIKALFPTKELDNIEKVALSIGMSVALVSISGLFLNYTPWGIRIVPITLSLLTLTITFASIAVLREYSTQLEEDSRE